MPDPRKPDPRKSDPGRSDSRRRVRVLLVEDHEDSLMAQAMLLRKRGYEVRTAANAAAALAVAGSEELDLVISDLRLPDRSGLELMRELKAEHALRGIALTGWGEEEDIRGSREAGFRKHLVKPIAPDQLQAAIEEVVGEGAEAENDE